MSGGERRGGRADGASGRRPGQRGNGRTDRRTIRPAGPPSGPRIAERLYAALLLAYPPSFRGEYGTEMRRTFREWRAQPNHRGAGGATRFWARVGIDIVRSAPREWAACGRDLVRGVARELTTTVGTDSVSGSPGDRASALHGRLATLHRRIRGRRAAPDPHPPPYAAATLAGLAVLALYVATLAPTIAFWDSAEYTTAAHILGIPHPPGSPLFVLAARAWEVLLEPTGLPTAVRINLFTATLMAAAHAFWFLVVHRALAGWADRTAVQTEDRPVGRPGASAGPADAHLLRRIAALAAVILSATAFTVWNQSNVTEKVYAISFLTTALVSWLLLRWRDTGRRPSTLLIVLVVLTLSATNHLMGVLVAPAALLFVVLVDHRKLLRPRLWLAALPLVAIALSVQLFLPIRAADRPILAEGDPRCESVSGAVASVYTWGRTGCDALSSTLTREQYGKPPVGLDPTVYPYEEAPRGASLVASQLLNYFQYFDWQWARSVAGRDSLFGGARPLVTLVFLLLGLLGARTHWRADRRSAAYMAALFLTLSVGLVLYLNFKFGYSIARDRFPDSTMHEVRERDYFYLLGFGVWGLWCGMGLSAVWRRTTELLRTRLPRPRLAAAPVLGIALLPLVLNWGWATRADDYTARDWAYNVLMSVEPYGVLFTNGDNDTFPLWYLQEVEGVRQDVTVVVLSYLRTDWYAKQLQRLTQLCAEGVDPAELPTRIVCQRPFDAAELPHALARAGWTTPAEPPEDSILPVPEEMIDRIAGSYYVTNEPLTFRAGGVEATIAEGTPMLPEDTFAATILRESIEDRPIHFMPGASTVQKLGLHEFTVRQGVVWRINDGEPPAAVTDGIVPLSGRGVSDMAGAAIDLPLTETLLWDVYLRRGRILDADAPWVDAAVTIPSHYAYAHYAAAVASEVVGETGSVERHARRMRWWEELVGG